MDCKVVSANSPEVTVAAKHSQRMSDPNVTNFDIEQSNDQAHAYAVMDDAKLQCLAKDIAAHDNSNEEEKKCPQT